MKNIDLKNLVEKNNFSDLEKKYFYISPYRQIKHQLILDIMMARFEELFEICYKKNSNIENLRSNDKIYIYLDGSDYKNMHYIIEKSKFTTLECILDNSIEKNLLSGVIGACELIGKGWEKEAIPISEKKKSFISGFFSKLFN